MKIRPEGAKLFHEDGRTDERTATTKLTSLFANFATAPAHSAIIQTRILLYSLKKYMTVAF